MTLLLDLGADDGNGLALTDQDRMDALRVALAQCRVPADAGALFNDEFRRAMAAARRGYQPGGAWHRMQACEARRRELEARLQGAAALPADPDMGE